MKPDTASPAPTCASGASDHSMDRPIFFKHGIKLRTVSPAPTCASNTSEHSMDRPIFFRHGMKPETASPAPTCTSGASDQSMDRPIFFKHGMKLRTVSPAPTCASNTSEHSMDRPIFFRHGVKLGTGSPAPTCASSTSDHSMDRPIFFKHGMRSEGASPASTSDHSMDRPIFFKHRIMAETTSPVPTCASGASDHSMDRPIFFKHGTKLEAVSPTKTWIKPENISSPFLPLNQLNRFEDFSPDISELSACLLTEDHFRCPVCTDVLKDPVSIPCGHSYCKTCIQNYWTKPTLENSYSCPQCRKRFRTRPALNPNPALAEVVQKLQQAGFSPALPAHCYAGPGDVACNFCTGRKLKAVKSCLSCTASYCETHVKQHYTVAALQRHTLVEVTGELEQRLCKLHQRALEVFCRTDQTFICLLCVMEEHKEHDTVLAKSEHPVVEDNTVKNDLQIIPFDSSKEVKIEKEMNQLLKLNEVLTTKVERAEGELAYLAKRFCRRLEEANDFTSDFVEVAALGRRLDLGMLYDCRNDSFSSDILLCDVDTLSSMRLSLPQHYTEVRILEKDTLQDRLRSLDLTSALRASVVSGLVEVSGAAAFLKHPTQSQLHDRVTVHYRTSARLDMLSHRLLHSGAPLTVTNQNSTHVVVAVLYGAQAFLVFDNIHGRREENPELRATVKKMVTSSCATELLSSLSDSEQISCMLYDCAIYQDPDDVKASVNFDTAVNLYCSLEKLLGPHSEIAVPLKVWLYPLNNLDPTAPHVVRDLSEDLLVKAEKVLELFEETMRNCQDMIDSYNNLSVISWFPALKRDLNQFCALLQHYLSEFQRGLASCIKTIREKGEKSEESLQDLLKRNKQSPFSQQNLQQWLQNKDAEVRALNECRTANITIVKSRKDLKHLIKDSQADRVLCFTFTSLESEDTFLLALKQHIDLMNILNTQDTEPPLRLVDISQKISSDLHLFLSSKEAHHNEQQIKFIAASVPDQGLPGTSIRLYQSGGLVSRNIKLELNLETPEIITVSPTSVTMKLQKLQSLKTESTDRYRVEYRAVSSKGRTRGYWKWNNIEICSTEENCWIKGLKPETQYQLRYAVMDSNSMSDYSRITEFQTPPRARPGQPAVLKQQKDSLTVSWSRAEADGDSPVLRYMVEYKEAGLEGWQSILTEGPECECTIALPYSTCYRVRVSAVYNEGDNSKPSEETEVPVESWIIDLSKRKASLFLEVLKLFTVKKPVELWSLSIEESEVRSFLQCLPYISQLRFYFSVSYKEEEKQSALKFLVSLFAAAERDTATGESYTELLSSVCSYETFPFEDYEDDEPVSEMMMMISQCDFLLDLFSHVKNYETQTDRNVLPALQTVFQSAPAVWIINLSERRSSLFLEVLKLQTVKKPVELRGWSDEESEVRSFLQCLPFISQLRCFPWSDISEDIQMFLDLFSKAAEHEIQTGEKILELLTSVCTYSSFPYGETHRSEQSEFLLDLFSHVKNYETQTGRNVLPALQPVYQSAPAVWNINLSERKISLFLEVLELQTVKKPVELSGWSDEESEVRSFLQCLPYISQLSGAEKCLPSVCKVLQSSGEREQVVPLLQVLDFTLSLEGKLPTSSCRAVGRVLGSSASSLNLTVNPQAISLRGTRHLFRHITHLHSLRLSDVMVMRILRALRAATASAQVTVEELSLIQSTTQWSQKKQARVLSSLASLLRLWNVQCLNLTEHTMEVQSLTVLLCHQTSLTIRLSNKTFQKLTVMVNEAQDEELTHGFLQKVGGDLTSCSLNWKTIHYFLQYHTVTVDFRKSSIKQQNIRELVSVLDRVQLRRLTSSFVLPIIREMYETGSAHCVSSLLSSLKNCIILNSRELDSVHCAALRFILQHCTAVSLSLLWTSIPEGELERIMPLLNHVSHLSVDRLLLLRLLHCCSVSEPQQGAAEVLLSALQHRLDFSCSSALDLTDLTQTHTLSSEDCRVVSMTIQRASTHTQLLLQDCEIEESGVEQLFTILHKVTLHCSKALLLQFLSHVHVGTELDRVRRAMSLSRALGEEVDLSETQLNLQVCRSLALVLEHSEGLTELDLSHCHLTDHCLELLLPHLHKTNILDLSHNNITDLSAKRLYNIVSSNSNIQTVRLFNNRITDRLLFQSDQRFEIW